MKEKEIAEIVELFDKFLAANRARKPFIRGLKTRNETYKSFLKRIIKAYEINSFFILSFSWVNTKQGVCFWSRLNDKWNKLTNNLKKE